ncbi:MAG TPA: hypothetical protein VHJ59_06445 [Nitrososphaera sp.]|jgi:hypothetical protein|nr:hypothetical protein [Nitrososphaera sp.]
MISNDPVESRSSHTRSWQEIILQFYKTKTQIEQLQRKFAEEELKIVK